VAWLEQAGLLLGIKSAQNSVQGSPIWHLGDSGDTGDVWLLNVLDMSGGFGLVWVLGFELSVWHLLGRHSAAWAMSPAFLAFSYFHVGSQCLFRAHPWTTILLFMLPA
jgi:hypothetical protein